MITADWYFTRCLDTEKEPDRAAALLGILECVDHGDRDPLTQRLAVEELMRLDSWMQTYALPRVLALADRAMPAVYAVCDRYFESLVSEVSEHEPLLDLLHAAISDDSRELIRAFGAAMQRQSHASHQPTDRPYLDARDFLPENVILAALARAVERNGRLAEDLRGDVALLRPLVQRALDEELGRLAFVLGVRLSFVCGYDSLEDLGRRVRKHPGFLLQPDLVELWIWLHFIGSGATSAEALLHESIELAHFHRFPASVPARAGKPQYVHPLPDLSLNHWRATEVILWQFALWTAAASVDAQATASFLAKFWLLPHALGRRVVMTHPGPQRRAEEWRKTLQDVTVVRRDRIALAVQEGTEAWPGEAAAYVASPFVEMDAQQITKFDAKRRRYPTTIDWVALLRLLLGTSLAARLLPQIENDDDRPFAALLVQAHDALSSFELRTQNVAGIKYAIAPTLRVLALFAQQQIKEAASCNDPAVSPNTFLALFECGPDASQEELTFCANVLPSVLMSFIADCFASAIRGNGEARWLDTIVMIAPALGAQDDYHRRESQQVIRFLSGDLQFPLTDWRQGRSPNWNFVHYRDLLVDSDPRPVDWYRPDWKEPNEVTNKSYRQLRLTRVVQRFVASFRDAGDVPADVLAEWRKQLVDELAVMNHEREFDRFLRLRLIEIVSDPTLDMTLDERRTIAGVILEFGSSFHVQRLLDELFPFEPMSDPRPADARLRADLLPVVMREAYAAGIPESSVVRDPRDTRRRLERRRVLRDALGRISALAATDPAYADVAQRLTHLRRESDQSLISDLQRATLDYDGDSAAEWQLPADRPPAAREIVSVSRDPNRMTVTVLFGDYETGGAVSLFDAGRDQRETLLGQEQAELLAFVVAVAEEGATFAVTLNCGLGAYVKWRSRTNPRLAEGARVAVAVKRNGTAWEVAEAPVVLARKRAVRYAEAQLEIDVMRSANRISLRVAGRSVAAETEPRGPNGFFDRRYWVPLIRDSFANRKQVFRTIAEHLDTGEWRPIAHELWQLAAGARGRADVALTIVDVRQAEEVLIVCSTPGSLYTLRFQDLSEADRERVEAMIEEWTDARGVQLLGAISLDDRRLQIRLAKEPFDFRDARWRAQFSGVDNCLAERRGSQFGCAAIEPLEGYPDWIGVTLVPPPPPRDAEVDFSPTGRWDPWRVSVTGTPIFFNELSIPEERRPAFVDDWARLAVGKPVTIKRTIAPVSQYGDLLCSTTDGVTVSVAAESLTMGSLEQRIRGDLNRQAEVTRVQTLDPLSFDLDASELPDEVVGSPRSVGVIARAPRLKDVKPNTRVPLGVWWQCGTSVVAADLSLPVESARRLHLGSLVEAKPSGQPDLWKVRVTPRNIKARALWRLAPEEQAAPKDSLYLGVMSVGHKQQAVVERAPGLLVPLVFTPNAKHMAAFDGARYVGGFSPQDRVRVDSPSGGRVPRLQVLVPAQSADRNVVWGDASLEHRGDASVAVQVRMLQRPESWFVLERYFRVTAKQVVVAAPRVERSEDLNAKDREALERYFGLPDQTRSVSVVSPQLVRLHGLRVPQHGHPNRWSGDVPVHKDGGPYLQGVDYSRQTARARLFREEDGRVFASFRLVPSFDVAAYIDAEFGDNDVENEPLKARLYYAGKEGTQHRFEWEYGWSMLADEADLRIDGKKFATAESLLFIGDAVTHASVLREGDRRILSFVSLTIRYSESSHIYFQRKKRVVHVLKLTADGEHGLKINTVIGMAEHSTADSHPFTRSRATLTPAAQQIVRERFAARGEAAVEGLTIFGRFDDEAYRQSLGRISSFDHVMATIDLVTGLRGDELVFLTATRLRTEMRNDCAVIVSPIGLDPQDVGADLRELTILRRRFSVREEVLSRIAETDPSMIDGRMYLVRLTVESQGADAKRVFGSLWRNMPVRSSAALKTLLGSGFVLATVVNDQANKSRALDVEYSPGIFLRVPYDQLQFDDPELDGELPRGTVIRLDAVDGRIRITRGAFAETRYIPVEGLRTVVVLPKNELADKRRDEFQRGNASWSALKIPIGGLPNVLAIPGQYDAQSGRWYPPNATKFRELMQQQHPKLALAGVDHNGDVRITPNVRGELAGSIAWDDATRQPRFVPHPSTEGTERPLEWSSLSFADVSAQDLARRMKNEKWRYHDTITPTWMGRDGVRDQQLRAHDGTTGPLFFAEAGGDLTLRFAPEAIQEFGFSARELVASLERGGTEYIVALATSSALWIEITPGRVAEVPYSQMVTDTSRGLVPLEKLHWEAFAPGDRIRLRLASDPKVADKVVLVDWWPGPRGAFPQAAVLPVIRHDPERGEIELGAGEFRMLYPRIAPEPRPVVRLSPVNRLTSAHPDNLRIGDSALLVIEDGVLRIAGVDGTAVPSGNRRHWEGDPFAEIFAGPWRDMKNLVAAAGGALPVTIEGIGDQQVYFSRHHQAAGSVIPPGKLARCRVLGTIGADSMLLRHGSGLITASPHFVISGLPRSLFHAAAALLYEAQLPVWVRRPEDGGEYEFGLAEDGYAVDAEVIEVLSSQQYERTVAGLVCRSRDTGALYWLPIESCAWTRLTPDEARAVFVRNPERKSISAAVARDRLNNRVLTITGTAEALAELRTLDVDQEIAVRIVAPRAAAGATAAPSHYLVETRSSSRMLLDCRIDDPPDESKKDIRVEIIRRVMGRLTFVLSTPVNTRRYSVDLPTWMMTDEMNDAAARFLFTAQERWLASPRLLVAPDDDQLDQALCQLWAALEEKVPVDAEQAGILVDRWAARSLRRDEIELTHALICLLSMWQLLPERRKRVGKDVPAEAVRDFVQVWSQQASNLLRNVGHRAVRSLHVEVLSSLWIKREAPEPPRLGQLRKLLRGSMTAADLALVRQFCRYAELGGAMVLGKELQLISDGLRRAIGEPEIRDTFHHGAQLLHRLANLAGTIPDTPNVRLPIDRAHVTAVREILDAITSRKLDITLLAPIPIVHGEGEG